MDWLAIPLGILALAFLFNGFNFVTIERNVYNTYNYKDGTSEEEVEEND